MENNRISNEEGTLLGLMLTPGVGRTTVLQALRAARHIGISVQQLLDLPILEMAKQMPPGCDSVVEARKRYTDSHRARANELLERTAAGGFGYLSIDDERYPDALRAELGRTAPPFLFVRGNAAFLAEPAAGVVGAREATPRGLAVAAACAETFACEDIAVVSGGAAGVDSAAHEAALDVGGSTIVALPQGILDYCAPRYLEQGIADERAVVISEFIPDAPWETHAAVTRNATISALSRMLCVVEPKKTGGSIRTARLGLAQGKRVAVYGDGAVLGGIAAGVETLRREGAIGLLDANGKVSAARLLDLWRSGPISRPEQDTLW